MIGTFDWEEKGVKIKENSNFEYWIFIIWDIETKEKKHVLPICFYLIIGANKFQNETNFLI